MRPGVMASGAVLGDGHHGGALIGRGWARWSARLTHLPSVPGQPVRFGKSAAQQELDLGVGTAQLIGGPPGQGIVNGRIQPQQHALALAHRVTVPDVTGTESRR